MKDGERKMKAYKVLARKKRTGYKTRVLYSAVVYNKAGIRYKKLGWNVAPKWLAQMGYHLLAFRTIEDAVKFGIDQDLGSVDIWEVELMGIIKKMPPKLDIHQICCGNTVPFGDWPEGTIMAKKVKLIKKVK